MTLFHFFSWLPKSLRGLRACWLRARSCATVSLLLVGGVTPGQAQSDGEKILDAVKSSIAKQRVDLKGIIKKSKDEQAAVQIFLRSENFQFLIGKERFDMRVGKDSAELFSMDEAGTIKPFPGDKLRQPIANTDVTFEDFTFLFLYWPNPILLGENEIAGADCFRIQLNNPHDGESYKSVIVWIHKKYGMLWRVKAFDVHGNGVKQFDINQIMLLSEPNNYGIKNMQIQSLEGERAKSTSHIVFDDPNEKPQAPKGVK